MTAMRIPPLILGFAAALVPAVLAVAALAAPAPKFQSSADYVRGCAVARPEAACKEAFARANNWVRFNSDAQLCAPDLKTSFGSPEYDAAVDGEINAVTGWLKQNPDAAGLDYVQSLGRGLIAVYACK
jgi:hypothetical protein